MLLNASLMRLCGSEPAVLGIDHKLYPHTTHGARRAPAWAVGSSCSRPTRRRGRRWRRCEPSSTAPSASSWSSTATTRTTTCSASSRALAPLLPAGGMVLVADTLVEEFPEGHFEGRPWDRGNNPMTAVKAFLAEHDDFGRPRSGAVVLWSPSSATGSCGVGAERDRVPT